MDLKHTKIIVGLLAILLFLINACNSNSITGSGNIVKEHRRVSGFNKVTVSGPGHLFISQGDSESLEIACDDNIAAHILTIVKSGTLEIGPKNATLKPSEPIRYSLSLKTIDSLKTSGSVLIDGDALRVAGLRVVMSGSGKLSLRNLEAQSIEFDISGSGKINIESGNTKNQRISISGSGEFSVPNLKSENIDLTISGSGKAKVWATNEMDIKISGSGKVSYHGSPRISTNISGSGKIEGLDTK